MKKFEYMQLVFDHPLSPLTTKEMNSYGKNGWDAFAVREVSGQKIQVFFKREINE